MSLLDKRIQAFFEVAKQGTVLGASKRLGYTQTAITQRLKSLETEFKTTLFTRSRVGMRLTPEGAALLHYCKGAQELEGAVLSRISPNDSLLDTHVTLATPTSAMNFHFVHACGEIMKQNKGLYVHMVIDDRQDLLSLIRSGTAELAIVPPHLVPNEMDSKKLAPNRYIMVCTPKWKNRKLEDLLKNERVIDFYESDQTTLSFLKAAGLEDASRRRRLYVNHNQAMIELLLAGVGIGTLTKELAKPYLESGALIQLQRQTVLQEALALVWYPRPQMPNYLKKIIDAIR